MSKGPLLIGLGVVVALGGLVGWNKHKKQIAAEAYEQRLANERAARVAVADKHRARATSQIEAVKAVLSAATQAPRTTSRQPLDAPLEVVPTTMKYGEVGNALVVSVQPPAPAPETNLVPAFYPRVAPYLDNTFSDNDTMDVAGVEATFGQLEALQWVAVVRFFDYSPPSASVDDRFTGAIAKGDLALYSLATKALLGVTPIVVNQRDSARVTKGSDADRQLAEAFKVDVMTAVTGELAALIKGTDGPATPGAGDQASLERFAKKIELEFGLNLHFVTAGLRRVEVVHGETRPRVTLFAQTPKALQLRGAINPEVVAIVTKVLGAEADVVAAQAE